MYVSLSSLCRSTDSSERNGGETSDTWNEKKAFRSQLSMSSACVRLCVCVRESSKRWKNFVEVLLGLESACLCSLHYIFENQATKFYCNKPAHAIAPATHAIACVCLCSPWQAASSCWTWHLSWCYQVAEAITPLPGPPGHSVYLSRFGRHQRRESWWRLGCRVEFPLSLLHTVFTLDRCRKMCRA